MPTNTGLCEASTLGNRVAGASSSVLTEERFDLGAMLKDAVDQTRHGHKTVAAEVGYQPDYWSRVLTGERGVTLDKLAKMPVDVQLGFVASWASRLGVRVERRAQPREMDATTQALVEMIQQRRLRVTMEAL